MSIFETMFGSPKKESPAEADKATGSGANITESEVPTNPTAIAGVYTNNYEVLTGTEADEIIEKRKNEGWREQQ